MNIFKAIKEGINKLLNEFGENTNTQTNKRNKEANTELKMEFSNDKY